MKFLQLEILNLASLDKQGGEVINFEEGALGESTIFSIVGPTGSGKSTYSTPSALPSTTAPLATPGRKETRTRTSRFSGLQMPAKTTDWLLPTVETS